MPPHGSSHLLALVCTMDLLVKNHASKKLPWRSVREERGLEEGLGWQRSWHKWHRDGASGGSLRWQHVADSRSHEPRHSGAPAHRHGPSQRPAAHASHPHRHAHPHHGHHDLHHHHHHHHHHDHHHQHHREHAHAASRPSARRHGDDRRPTPPPARPLPAPLPAPLRQRDKHVSSTRGMAGWLPPFTPSPHAAARPSGADARAAPARHPTQHQHRPAPRVRFDDDAHRR